MCGRLRAVTAGDDVAFDLPLGVAHDPTLGVETLDRGVEPQGKAAVDPRRDQVPDDLCLSVDRDRAAAG